MKTNQRYSKDSTANELSIVEKRKALIAVSVRAKEIKRNLIARATNENEMLLALSVTLNEIILSIYEAETVGKGEWHRFDEWKKRGMFIKKNSKAFYVWGAPRKPSKENESKQQSEDIGGAQSGEYWPICALFHSSQIEETAVSNAAA